MKSDQEIEQILRSGKGLTLRAMEKDSIKSVLLTHVTQTLAQEFHATPSPFVVWLRRGSVSVASFVLLFIGAAYASQSSLPGEPLYLLKVQVVEEMASITKDTPEEKVAYSVALMEKRLYELHEIRRLADESVEIGDLTVLAQEVTEHVENVTSVLDSSSAAEVSPQQRIEALQKVRNIVRAQERVSEQVEESVESIVVIADAEEKVSSALDTTLQEFVSEQPQETVNTYLGQQIADVGEMIQASTTSESIRDLAGTHIGEVNDALLEGDVSGALRSILEAAQVVEVEKYLEEVDRSHELSEDVLPNDSEPVRGEDAIE